MWDVATIMHNAFHADPNPIQMAKVKSEMQVRSPALYQCKGQGQWHD
jgi:hypothetical protein